MIIDADDLIHYGKKGMKWGERRAKRKIGFKEVKEINKGYLAREQPHTKDPSFKREVKLTRKGRGISGTNRRVEISPIGGLLTSRIRGNFKNSEGRKVSEDFANAVMRKAVNQKIRRERIAAGALLAAAMVAPLALRR